MHYVLKKVEPQKVTSKKALHQKKVEPNSVTYNCSLKCTSEHLCLDRQISLQNPPCWLIPLGVKLLNRLMAK